MADFKAGLKRSKRLHSAYKMMRDVWAVPFGELRDLDRLSAVFRVLPNTMLPIPVLFDTYDAVVQLNNERIEGDVVECGVWNGGCVGLMALANGKSGGRGRRFHLFDSFEGLPEPTHRDADVVTDFRNANRRVTREEDVCPELVAIGACVGGTQSEVERFLVDYLHIELDALVFHVGWFQNTVPAAGIGEIALLRIDGDWYESTKTCLEGLYQQVVPGGYVIIDDYGRFSGCREATDEYFGGIGIAPDWSKSDENCVYFRKFI